MQLFLGFIFSLLCSFPAYAEDVYQQPDEFVTKALGALPKAKSLWIIDDMQPIINEIMDRPFRMMRIKYWEHDNKTAWILDEIGKFKPITTGVVIDNNTIERVKVLIYRESHGWEVKHDFFTDQFKHATLDKDYKLSTDIDNISGATMSVDALRNLGELALYLHKHRHD